MGMEQHIKVVKKDGFVLFGDLLDRTKEGVWIQTDQETSFISYDIILEIRKDPRFKELGQ